MNIEIWLAFFIVLLLIELTTMALTTIWFAVGSIGGFVVSLAGGPLWLQIVVFLLLSFITLIFYRPLAIKHINKKIVKTNVEELIGREGRITERVDNLSQTGRMVLNGMDWSARTTRDNLILEQGTVVKVVKVEGVKLIVEPLQ